MKILLVEDSYLERTKLGCSLTAWGLDYLAVGSGTEAPGSRSSPPNRPTWCYWTGSCPVSMVSISCGEFASAASEATSTL